MKPARELAWTASGPRADVNKLLHRVLKQSENGREWLGRVLYTSMGPQDGVWANLTFQSILQGGIAWALRNVDADVTPNLAKAAPHYGDLPASIK